MTTYNSVAELFEEIDRARERLQATLAGLSAEDENFREAPDRWSIAEVVEHVAVVEGQIVKVIGRSVGKAEAEGAPKASADGRIPPVEFGAIAERASREKYKAPETALPATGATVADSLSRLRATRDALEELRPRIEALDVAAYRFPHPVFGPLDPYQWLALFGLHEERHRQQIESLKGSAGLMGNGAGAA